MTTKIVQAMMAVGLLIGPTSLISTRDAHAQAGATVGSARGVVKDKASGGAAGGAVIVAQSPSQQGDQTVLADETGQFFLTNLPPGIYTITIFYADRTFKRSNIQVQVGKEAFVAISVDSNATAGTGPGGKPGGEIIEIQGSNPVIDQGSTKLGVVLNDDYVRNIPTGRTFGAVISSAAGAQNDIYGVSIAGSTSAENTYIVEGLNTTDTAKGGISSNLPTEFIAETEVITGGYNAEYGRATGGIINVVTKSGTNEFHGSVFGYFRPGALIANQRKIVEEGGSIDSVTNIDYNLDAGAEIGGPIIKDKLWFHVGFNPSFTKRTTSRILKSQVDENQDGIADLDANGITKYAEDAVDTREIGSNFQTYFFTAKINGAINSNHQFQISGFGNPRVAEDVFGLVRNPAASKWAYTDGAYDIAGKWTSKFNEGATQIDAVLGYHRGYSTEKPFRDQDNVSRIAYNYERSLADFADIEGDQILAACQDDVPGDMYPGITNCPVTGYATQGLGFLEERINDRQSALLTLTQRVKALGYHTFKGGAEVEISGYNAKRGYTGGHSYLRLARNTPTLEGRWQDQTTIGFDRQLTPDERATLVDDDPTNDFDPMDPTKVVCAGNNALCKNIPRIDADTTNRSIGLFVQDEWQIRPNFSINLGVRYEQQVGYVADEIAGKKQPTGETIPDRAYTLGGMFAPRAGFVFDPTQEGRAKIFGFFGRFYENVPMDINVRAFGGETFNDSRINLRRLPMGNPGYDPNCKVDHGSPDLNAALDACTDRGSVRILGDGTAYVSPGLKGQYTQEILFGAEYEVRRDLKVGLSYVHRSLPMVIEDISTDGGINYLITNPSENFDGEASKLDVTSRATLASAGCDNFSGDGMNCDADGLALANLQRDRARQLRSVKNFDKPVRNYDALQFTVTQNPTRNSLILASYTYSQSKGNYPGLFSTETGQDNPNLTSIYDLPDLMANRYGKMGLDRPHNLKVDGFYNFDFKTAGMLTVGGSLRGQSGIAHNALGAHPIYGQGESYLLPRGAIERSPFTYQLDLHLAYGYMLNKQTKLEGFVRIFNMTNEQEELNVDEVYTIDPANPVVNGTQKDLAHVKALDDSGYELNRTVIKNKNFNNTGVTNALLGNPIQAARNIQLGFRLTF